MSIVSTVGGVQHEIARRLNEISISATNEDRYTEWINQGGDDVASKYPRAPWLESSAVFALAAGSLNYQVSAIDAALTNVHDIQISTQNVKLKYLDKDAFDALDPKPDSQGIPSVYTIYNDEVQFYPIPNSNYGAQVNFAKGPTTVSASSTVPEIPRRYLNTLILYGWAQGLYVREDFNEAQLVELKYDKAIARMKQTLKEKALEPQRTISIREIQVGNRVYGDEITRAFFNR